jgi:L-fuconolactonase
MITVDSHQHFWEINRFDYEWMDVGSPLRSNKTPKDLEPLMGASNVDYCVTVQAHQSIEETKWLLKLAESNDFISGVVGWVDLADPKVGETLDALQNNEYFKGVRHLWHDEEDEKWMLNPGPLNGLREISRRGLSYDFLVRPNHLKYIPIIMDSVPNLNAVIDHIGKPNISTKQIEPWLSDLRKVASIESIKCKISGMVTEADMKTWTVNELSPYVHHVLAMFGQDRVMMGSDWPVCTLAADYNRVITSFQEILSGCNDEAKRYIFGRTAIEFYKLGI